MPCRSSVPAIRSTAPLPPDTAPLSVKTPPALLPISSRCTPLKDFAPAVWIASVAPGARRVVPPSPTVFDEIEPDSHESESVTTTSPSCESEPPTMSSRAMRTESVLTLSVESVPATTRKAPPSPLTTAPDLSDTVLDVCMMPSTVSAPPSRPTPVMASVPDATVKPVPTVSMSCALICVVPAPANVSVPRFSTTDCPPPRLNTYEDGDCHVNEAPGMLRMRALLPLLTLMFAPQSVTPCVSSTLFEWLRPTAPVSRSVSIATSVPLVSPVLPAHSRWSVTRSLPSAFNVPAAMRKRPRSTVSVTVAVPSEPPLSVTRPSPASTNPCASVIALAKCCHSAPAEIKMSPLRFPPWVRRIPLVINADPASWRFRPASKVAPVVCNSVP